MILVLDNRDSFVENLARYVRLCGVKTSVVRSTALSIADIEALNPSGIVLSPGPGRPEQAGISISAIRAFSDLPVLGVCLGHQCLAEAYGGATVRSPDPRHGRASTCMHAGTDLLFAGVPRRFQVGRYHSLTVAIKEAELRVTAQTAQGEIMALRHQVFPHFGVQFHPESLLTPHGQRMIQNFIDVCA